MLSHYVQLSSGIHHVSLVACSNMRALLHAYLVGLEALDLFFSEPPFTCTAFLYVRSDHRSLKFGPYITYIASKPKAHDVIT